MDEPVVEKDGIKPVRLELATGVFLERLARCDVECADAQGKLHTSVTRLRGRSLSGVAKAGRWMTQSLCYEIIAEFGHRDTGVGSRLRRSKGKTGGNCRLSDTTLAGDKNESFIEECYRFS